MVIQNIVVSYLKRIRKFSPRLVIELVLLLANIQKMSWQRLHTWAHVCSYLQVMMQQQLKLQIFLFQLLKVEDGGHFVCHSI